MNQTNEIHQANQMNQTNQTNEMKYVVQGSEMQFVELDLAPQQATVGQAGAMMFMDQGIKMETVFGDGSKQKSGFVSSLLSAGKRLITGESLFMTVFTNDSIQNQKVAFAAHYPGKIMPIQLNELGGEVIVQKQAFLAASRGVALEVFLQKKIGVGFFGGEGFVMQKIKGNGLCFIHAGGTIVEKNLSHNQTLIIDTGCVVGFQSSVNMDIKAQSSLKSALFSGESVFLTELKGPGKVWIQSLPFSRLIDTIGSVLDKRRASRGKNSEE